MTVAIHTHESEGEGDFLDLAAFETADVSLSGSFAGPNNGVSLILNAWAFFPMIYGSHIDMGVSQHPTDGVDPDSPRLSLRSTTPTVRTYNYALDYRYLTG